MAITILCPTCSTRLTLTDDRAGTTMDCPKCETKMLVPGTAPSQAPARPVHTPFQTFPESFVEEDEDDSVPVRKRRSKRRRDDDEDLDDDDDNSRRSRSVRQRGFECPYCGSHRMPLVKSQISSTGWIVFALLLIFTVCLCFIGLFITEETRHCRDCGMKLS